MRFTAENIRNQSFKARFRGLDKDDVNTYLQLVADDFEDFQMEVDQQKNQLKKQNEIINKLKERDKALQNRIETLSKKESASLIKEDIQKGKEIIQKALNRARDIKELTAKEVYRMGKEIIKLEEHKKRLMGSVK